MKNFSNHIQLSIALCTWNPEIIIEETLKSLAHQTFPDENYEVLVIDNGSENDISQQLIHFCDLYNFRYILEDKIGLSYARNRSIKEARGDYIYFIDDDAIAPSHLLETVLKCFHAVGCDVVGGPVHGLWEQTPPRWLGSRYWRMLSLVSYGPTRRQLSYPEIPIGCNIGFHKSVFETFGLFREDLGRKGKSLIGHEERELLHRVMEGGKKVYYEPRAYVFHNVSLTRMQPEYLKNRAIASSKSSRLMNNDSNRLTILRKLTSFAYGQLLSIYHALIFGVELYIFETKLQIGIQMSNNDK